MSFILKFVRWGRRIDTERDILGVEGHNPFVVIGSFLLERIYDFERKDDDCVG